MQEAVWERGYERLLTLNADGDMMSLCTRLVTFVVCIGNRRVRRRARPTSRSASSSRYSGRRPCQPSYEGSAVPTLVVFPASTYAQGDAYAPGSSNGRSGSLFVRDWRGRSTGRCKAGSQPVRGVQGVHAGSRCAHSGSQALGGRAGRAQAGVRSLSRVATEAGATERSPGRRVQEVHGREGLLLFIKA